MPQKLNALMAVKSKFVPCGFADAPPRGGILVTKNDDVYAVVRDKSDLKLLGTDYEEALPKQPVKIEKLCGNGNYT